MCAEFMIRSSNQKILRSLGVPVKSIESVEDVDWNTHARLYSQAPVVLTKDGDVDIRPMAFSLKPKDTPFPTFNARLMSWDDKKNKIVPIYEKPTWKGPLKSARCVVPMTGFVEPAYVGDHAGEMVEFKLANHAEEDVIFCAGLYASHVDKKTGEIFEGFTLIIHTPSAFVLKKGHHRQPVLLPPAAAQIWIKDEEIDPKAASEFLMDQRWEPDLTVVTSRTMAKGWEKRVSDYERKLATEMKFMEKLEQA